MRDLLTVLNPDAENVRNSLYIKFKMCIRYSAYTYNTKGIRTGKTVNGVKHTYTLEGTKILREAWGNLSLIHI